MPLTVADVRSELIDLSQASAAEVAAIFNSITHDVAEEVRDLLLDELPALIEDYHLAASSLAADWYDDLREAAEVRGSFQAITADLPDPEQINAAIRFGVGPLFTPNPNSADALTLLQGSVQRIMANGHRDTVRRSSIQDRRTTGWARYGNGDTCRFCRMLIGRGDVYRADTAKFGAHDHCKCVAGPIFEDAEKVNGYIVSPRKPIDASGTSADAERAKEWMDANLPA